MKKIIFIFSFLLLILNCFSQNSIHENANISSINLVFIAALFSFLIALCIVLMNYIFRKKIHKNKAEYQINMEQTIKTCDEKISKSEAEMLKTLNASISEIHADYMNKILQIRTDIESHRAKIYFLMENNKEMKEFYEDIIKDHFNPIIQNLN